jgi:hypothetical protein
MNKLTLEQEIEIKYNKQFYDFFRQNSNETWFLNLMKELIGKDTGELSFGQRAFNRKSPDQIGENESVMIVFENKTISKTDNNQFKNYSKILLNDPREKIFIFIAPKYSKNIEIFNKFTDDEAYKAIKYIFVNIEELFNMAKSCGAPAEFLQFLRIHSKEINYKVFDSLFTDVINELQRRGVFAEKRRPIKSNDILPYHQKHFLFKGVKKPEFRLRIGFQHSDTDRFIIAWYKFQCGEYAFTMGKEKEDADNYIKRLKKKNINKPDLFAEISKAAEKVHSVYLDLQNNYDFAYFYLTDLYDIDRFEKSEIKDYADKLEKEIVKLFNYTKERLRHYGCSSNYEPFVN